MPINCLLIDTNCLISNEFEQKTKPGWSALPTKILNMGFSVQKNTKVNHVCEEWWFLSKVQYFILMTLVIPKVIPLC